MPGDFSYRGGASILARYDPTVLLLEDCEESYKWTNSGTGADYTGSFDASFCYFGTKGWKLRTRATTPAANDYVRVARYLTYPAVRKLVVRGRVNFSTVSLVKTLAIEFAVVDGVTGYTAALLFTPNTPKVEYVNSAGAYVAMASLAHVITADCWYTFEIALDLVGLKYISASFGGTVVDLSAQGLYSFGGDTRRVVMLAFQVTAIGAAMCELGMDAIYLGSADQV